MFERIVAMPMPAATNAGSIEGIEGESPAARFVARKPTVKMIALRTNVVFENTCKGITGESCVFDLLTTNAINRKPLAKEMLV